MSTPESVIRVGDTVTQSFFVVDPASATGAGKTGATFTTIFARYGSGNTAFTPTFTEVGSGEYQISFTPTAVGTWRALWSASTGDEWFEDWQVLAASARADQPFAWRVGDRVTGYRGVTDASGAPVTVTAASWTLRYARSPDGTTFNPVLVREGLGEYSATFTPTQTGTYRALWTYVSGTLSLEMQFSFDVLAASATTASGMSRAALRVEVARRLGLLTEGTLTSASSGSAVADTSRTEQDGAWRGGTFYVVSGGAAGLSTRVAQFANSGGAFTLTPALTTVPASGDAYQVLAGYAVSDFNAAIDAAVREAYWHSVSDLVDETTTVAQNVWSYAIPDGFNTVYQVWLQQPTFDDDWRLLRPSQWQVEHSATAPKIRLDPGTLARWGLVGRAIRICGQQYAQPLGTDADTTLVPANWIVPFACAYLLRVKSMGRMDTQGREERITAFLQEAMAARADEAPPRLVRAGTRLVRAA